MRAELWLSLNYLKNHKKTPAFFISCIALLGIALGVAALILVISVMSGFDQEVKKKLLGFNYHTVAYFNDNIDVQSEDEKEESTGPQAEFGLKDHLERIKQFPEVDNAVVFAETQTAIRFNKQIAATMVVSIEFNGPEKEHWETFLTRGDLDGVIVGRILAYRLGLKLGDEIELLNPTVSSKLIPKLDKFKVAGFFEVGLYDIDDMVIVMPAHLNERFDQNLDKSWAVGARLKDPDIAAELKYKFYQADWPQLSNVSTWIDRNKTLFTWLKLEKIGSYIILSLIILVAAFNIFATQSIRVVEKIKDIGILKTIGLRHSQVCGLFCMQGMLIGLLGTLLGMVLGLGLCYLVGYTDLIPLPAELYHIDHIPVLINWTDIGGICAIALGLSFIFSIFPALKAGSFKVVDAISYE